MRRAEWRRRADDPKTALGWWRRGAVEAGRLLRLLILMVMLALCWGHPAFLGLPFLAMVLMEPRLRRWKPDRLAPLLPDPAPEGQFRAAVEYRRDGLVTGRDEMALTVVDGWLVGEGVRSDFALGSANVRRLRLTSYGARIALEDGGEVRLLGVLDPGRTTLGRWHDWKVLPDGEPTFLPARVHPQEKARWVAWVMLGGMTWPTLNLIGALVSQGAEGRLAWMLTGLALGGLAAAVGVIQLKRLSQIEADAKKALAGQAPPLKDAKGDGKRAFL